MAHKKLLTEAEIRRFMKLATIGGVGDNKIQEMGYTHPGGHIEEQEDEELDMGAEMGDVPEEEPAGDEEMEMGPEEEPVGGEEEMGGMETGEREELPAGRDMGAYQESIVNEVAKRVAARLVKEGRREKMAKQLTERIFARLTNK